MQSTLLTGEYHFWFMALSVVVAVLAAYTALDLAQRGQTGEHKHPDLWLAGSAFALGTGVWSMHFALLWLNPATASGYGVVPVLASWLVAVATSGAAFKLTIRRAQSTAFLVLAAFILTTGFLGVHYTGMYARYMQPAQYFQPLHVVVTLIIAFNTSFAALWLGLRLGDDSSPTGLVGKAAAAVLLGLATFGVQYPNMTSGELAPTGFDAAALGLEPVSPARLVGITTVLLLGILLIVSMLDQRSRAQYRQLVLSLRGENAELHH